jgi:malonyl-CoA O-methyltransferase
MLDPNDIPVGAHFDPVALEIPVALVFALRHPS